VGVAALSAIIGTQSGTASLAGNVTVFRIAFFAAAGFTLVGAIIALAIRDTDAASTMRRAAAATSAIPAA
jgi:hypothetical protein